MNGLAVAAMLTVTSVATLLLWWGMNGPGLGLLIVVGLMFVRELEA